MLAHCAANFHHKLGRAALYHAAPTATRLPSPTSVTADTTKYILARGHIDIDNCTCRDVIRGLLHKVDEKLYATDAPKYTPG